MQVSAQVRRREGSYIQLHSYPCKIIFLLSFSEFTFGSSKMDRSPTDTYMGKTSYLLKRDMHFIPFPEI